MELLSSHWTDFNEIWYLSTFRKFAEKIKVLIKIGQEWRVLYMKTKIQFWSYLAQFFLEWKMFQEKVYRNSKHTFRVQQLFFFSKIVPFMEQCGKKILYSGAGHRWQCSACALHCWIPKDTNTRSEYVTTIAFPQQQRLRKCAPMLHYTYTACLLHDYLR
jgi:hypothetical protein